MKVLHLTLKKKWFDMIASGEKKEEYREIKPYWGDRLTWEPYPEVVEFRNGYRSDSPRMRFEIDGDININEGREEWGAEPGKKYFVIKLGERII